MFCSRWKGNSWKLLPLADSVRDVLDEAKVPGLALTSAGAFGPIDAIAAACKLVGYHSLPPAPTPLIRDGQTLPNLRAYQVEGVALLQNILKRCGGALLGDEMGLGKTRQAITLAKVYAGRKLILCPAATRLTWQRELAQLGETGYVIDPALHSKLKSGKRPWPTGADSIITSYDLATKVYDLCFPEGPPQFLIADEAHNLSGRGRGKGNKRVTGIKDIAITVPNKLALTGTPVWDSPRDLLMVLDILLNGKFGRRWDFDIRYCGGRINEWGGMDNHGCTHSDELRLRLGYYLVRRTKAEVATDLPPLTRTVEWLDPVPKCTALWHQSILTKTHGALSAALESTHEHKLDRAVELARQAPDGRFLLFTYLRAHAEVLADRLEVPFVHGGMPPALRQKVADQAIAKKTGLVATLDSMGVGVNIQGVASFGIMHALSWTPNKLLQAEGRLHRIGQTLPVQWVYLCVRESADEHVARAVVDKLDNYMALLGQETATRSLRDSVSDSKDSDAEAAALRLLYEELA